MKLETATFCVLDTETTSGDPEQARLVEVATCLNYPDGRLVTWSKLSNPGIPIPAEAKAVHHITDDMVPLGPLVCFVIPDAA